MLKIRLQRFGRKREPTFRVVLTDSRSGPKSGNFLEVLGSHDPRGRGKEPTALKQDRILHWISKGAQTSDTVHNLLIRHDIIKGEKIDVSSKKKGGEEKKEDVEVSQEIKKDETQTSPEAPADAKAVADKPAGEAPPSLEATADKKEEPIETQKEVDEEGMKKKPDEKTEDSDKQDTEKTEKNSDKEPPKKP
ncbi:30S ribosomal protein S16 [bacterium]|nr:30S ribosomal protein S16 [bacterium]|tara:strand:- start:10169 stop:10744 length:576 start_codon:yes stop_codon:yes gene_type:complete